LGFDQKWMMGWMHDTLKYFGFDPIHRNFHHSRITFSLVYAFSEHFQLPFSHDEVVHGKSSLINKMPGDEWKRFANLRALYSYMFTHPGTNLLFMGGEFAQTREWNFKTELEWHLLEYDFHKGVQNLIQDLNELYKASTALYEQQFAPEGFQWIDHYDHGRSILSYVRKGKKKKDLLLVVCNFTPVLRENFRVGVPLSGKWTEVLNSDAAKYGGGNKVNSDIQKSTKQEWNKQVNSIEILLPPLGVSIWKKV